MQVNKAQPFLINFTSRLILNDIMMMKRTRMFHARNDVIHVRTLWSQKVVPNGLLQKEFTQLDSLPHEFLKM